METEIDVLFLSWAQRPYEGLIDGRHSPVPEQISTVGQKLLHFNRKGITVLTKHGKAEME
jgi:hypothetical protein